MPRTQWYQIRAEAGQDPEILIYDRIGEGFFDEGLTAKVLVEQLAAINAEHISVRINSPGGSVFDGLAIYNVLKAHPAKITTHIDGLAASIASVIALAGDHVNMADNALFMIHNPMAFADGDAEDLRRTADILDRVRASMVSVYSQHTALTDDELAAAMNAETWYTADEALEAGFVSEIASAMPVAAQTFDLSMFTRPPVHVSPDVATDQPQAPSEEKIHMPDVTAAAPPQFATIEALNALEARMTTPPAPRRTLGVVEAFVEQIRVSKGSGDFRAALADVINTGNSGVLPPAWSSEVRNFVDRLRYMIPQAGSISFPSSGYTLTVPKVLQHTMVAARGAQKSEIPSRALTTGQDTYTATWYAGGVDVALELIWQSEPAVWEIIVADLLQQYAEVTDQAFTSAVAAAGQPTGAVLPVTDYKAFIAAVIPQAEAIRLATGQFGDRLALTTATWGKLIGFTDADGRRILAPGGAVNSDGTAALLERSVNLGGILAFHNPRIAEDVLFNQVSVRVAEKPPVTLTQDVVALMGRDVGVLGAMMDVLYPAGIKTFSVTELAAASAKK